MRFPAHRRALALATILIAVHVAAETPPEVLTLADAIDRALELARGDSLIAVEERSVELATRRLRQAENLFEAGEVTLVATPVVYSIFDDWAQHRFWKWAMRMLGARGTREIPPQPQRGSGAASRSVRFAP